jgi:curli production assembly/transport component CsgG|tara:strand:+ start:947 stop:1759 length:813 start_codon:yes stop_codon:yes gene_type:complete
MKKATQQRLLYLSVLLLSSCALIIPPLDNGIPPIREIEPAQINSLFVQELKDIGPPVKKPVVAVYGQSFQDNTGQRRSNSQYASFSTAITSSPDAYLIRALKHSNFFDVVERKGLDNLTKERQLIRTTRENFEEKQQLKPLLFAGLLMEGGVIGYETNIKSGGAGARYLGIGGSKEYRQDSITVSLRTVSVSTGKVLIEVLVTKSVLSASISQDVFRFYNNNTELVEIESGIVENESVNIALQTAVETAVLQTILEGLELGYWERRSENE